MGKTCAQVEQQIRELVGDYQATTYQPEAVIEAINWGQNVVMRLKGFKVSDALYTPAQYPTGEFPSDWLCVKRVLLVTPTGGLTPPSYDDTVHRVLEESAMSYEDAVNEMWKTTRAKYLPRRWTLVGNKRFSIVPPFLPTDGSGTGYKVRVHYIPMATPVAIPADDIDVTIPDYYQEAIRYIAVCYLLEKDTDLKSVQLKAEMYKSFQFHMASGLEPLAITEQDS